MTRSRPLCGNALKKRGLSFMNAPPDQRVGPKFVNLKKAVEALEAALVDPIRHPREMAGIIQNFEIVYEVAWTTLKLFLELEGHPVRSAKETFAKAYQLNYIGDEDIWMDMIKN